MYLRVSEQRVVAESRKNVKYCITYIMIRLCDQQLTNTVLR
jgi:hypothetical protein